MKKTAAKNQTKTRKCPFCGESIENPDINYCPNCRSVIWPKSLLGKRLG